MTEAPTDALRLVQELRLAACGLFTLKNETGDYGYFDTLADRVEALAAAPASPLPGGGWKPSRNDVARRCDPKAWEFYDRHIDNPIMRAECRAEVAASIRMADAILALPAAPTGDA